MGKGSKQKQKKKNNRNGENDKFFNGNSVRFKSDSNSLYTEQRNKQKSNKETNEKSMRYCYFAMHCERKMHFLLLFR